MKKIGIIGGCGHVGFPLGIVLASRGFRVTLIDINETAVQHINSCKTPFMEENSENYLSDLVGKFLFATTDKSKVKEQDVVFFVTETFPDEDLNPSINGLTKIIKSYLNFLSADQLLIVRSTVFPGTFEFIESILVEHFGSCKLSFCPERLVQGKGIEEISIFPQIISANSELAETESAEIFSKITKKLIFLNPNEAELVKLITNSWRYLEFAIANQFYMMVEDYGFDFHKIFLAIQQDYPRAQYYARSGFTAGPCLLKDTKQLSGFYKNNFYLGQAAMLVNEGLSDFVVAQIEKKIGSIKNKKIAIFGMTFKANNDDIRESLSFKVKEKLELKMATVLCVDPYLKKTDSIEMALECADGLILGAPHKEFFDLKPQKPFVDCWGIWKKNSLKITCA